MALHPALVVYVPDPLVRTVRVQLPGVAAAAMFARACACCAAVKPFATSTEIRSSARPTTATCGTVEKLIFVPAPVCPEATPVPAELYRTVVRAKVLVDAA